MRHTKWCFPAVAFAAILMICGASSATTRYVDPSNCPGAGDGTIGNPFCTIQDAINACVDGDVIELADGVYSGPGNVGLDFVLLSVTVRSANGPENCILDGEGANRHVRATEVGTRTFIGLSFINGFATEPFAWGGAIYIGGITYIINCRFQNNMAQNHGAIHCTKDLIVENSEFSGGVAMGYSTSAINCKTLTMKNCTFSNHLNTIVRCDGGLIDQCVFRDNISTLADDRCIYAADDPVVISNSIFERNDEVLHVDSNDAIIENCTFRDNTGRTVFVESDFLNGHSLVLRDSIFENNTSNSYIASLSCETYAGTITVDNCQFRDNIGTALHLYGDCGQGGGCECYANVTNCTFERNVSDNGGAIWAEAFSTITECNFTDNTATTGDGKGGAIYSSVKALLIDQCHFNGNEALRGGAVYGQSPDLENRIHRSAFVGNSAVFEGGAVYYNSVRRGATSCYFLGNDAGTSGGAVYASQCELATRLGNCSFYDNTAATGPAVACDSDLRIDNCIIWNHGANPLALAGGTHDVRYSDIEHGYIGTGNINANPLFVDPIAADFRLSSASPCIDAGGNNMLPAYALNDFAGNPRRVDDPNTVDTGFGAAPVVDMGAYEFTGPVGPTCAADLTGGGGTPDGNVDVTDLFLLLANWNTSGPGADLAAPTNIVDVADLFALLADWGPCD